jgi:putative cardiolipin synthase
MGSNFDEFWESELSVPVEEVLDSDFNWMDAQQKAKELHAYAQDPVNFDPLVREAIASMPARFPTLLAGLEWQKVEFVSDAPGKNDGSQGLGGGGEITQRLVDVVRNAEKSVLIQSPYLVMPKGGVELFTELNARGVETRISTNSLASTDNIPAFSGYHRQRARLLNAGIKLYEYKPHPGVRKTLIERYPELSKSDPIFALHAKSMVVDDKLIYIGTFNLDPRSANLNTEVGVLIENETLARRLTAAIEQDMLPENSWQTTAEYAPDFEVPRGKRLKLGFVNLLPIEPLL